MPWKSWSYRAQDSTLRAVRNSGFNEKTFPLLKDIIMATEPEAAAVYTARHLKQELGQDFLKVSVVGNDIWVVAHEF